MVLSDCGHRSGTPTGVASQSNARMRAPISPPPARKLRSTLGVHADGDAADARPVMEDVSSRCKLVVATLHDCGCRPASEFIVLPWRCGRMALRNYGPSR